MSDKEQGSFDFARLSTDRTRFEPGRLRQARARAGLSKTELANAVNISPAAIGQYEAGVNSPRPDVLLRISKALGVRPDFFTFGRPLAEIESHNVHFRSLRTAKTIDRQRALATATLCWELTFALERFVRLPKPDLPQVPQGSTPESAAHMLRQHWELPSGPVKHLTATAESHGVVINTRPLGEIDAVDAFSVLILERPIVITTPRRSENVFRHRFSVAHELGHLILHADRSDHNLQAEHDADAFAAAFLTPAAAMDEVLPTRLDLNALERVARTWGVSPHSLVRRMVERGRTAESSARRAYQRLTMLDDPAADPTRAYAGETPKLLKRAADLAAAAGGTIPVLAEALKLSPAQVRSLLGEEDSRPLLRVVDGGN